MTAGQRRQTAAAAVVTGGGSGSRPQARPARNRPAGKIPARTLQLHCKTTSRAGWLPWS
jgi:hypothetical protein